MIILIIWNLFVEKVLVMADCNLCGGSFDELIQIRHGESEIFMCRKSWNDWLCNLLDPSLSSDDDERAFLIPDICPNEEL